MGINVTGRVNRPQGSRNDFNIVAQEIQSTLDSLAEPVLDGVREKMRQGVKDEEKSSVISVIDAVEGSVALKVSSDSIEAVVDERGKDPGSFPPFGLGSDLYEWVMATMGVTDDMAARGLSFLVARQQFERGLPNPSDVLREPFRTTQEEFTPSVIRALHGAGAKAVEKINHGIS